MKKLLSMFMVLSMLFLVACSGGNNSSDKNLNKLEQIKKNGKIVVGTSADYPPYEFHAMINGKDEIVGFDIEIAKKIAEEIGVEIEIQDMGFDAVLAGVGTGIIDIGIAGVSKTKERDEVMDFSNIYYDSTHTVITTASSNESYKSIEDFEGKTVGVQLGSIQEGIAQKELKDVNIKSVGKVTDLILELKTGIVDLIIVETAVAESYVKQNSDLKLGEIIFSDDEGGSSVITANGEDELMEVINKVIEKLKSSGDIDKFVADANELAESIAE